MSGLALKICSLLVIFSNYHLSIMSLRRLPKNPSFKLGCATSVNIWRDTVVYEELTINERQKKDKEYSVMFDGVRRGCPTDETLNTLEQRVIDVSVADKFDEFQKSGHTHQCVYSLQEKPVMILTHRC